MKHLFSINRLRATLVLGVGLLCLPMAGQQAAPSPQTESLAKFVRNIVDFNQRYLQEKVYLHFDNHGYFMGENIWFKAYVVNPMTNRPQILSRVLYVELLTPEGRVVQTHKCKIENGQASGQISLNNLLHAGFYEVRAYTALMLNWKDAPVFSRVFPIFTAPQTEGEGMYDNPRMVSTPYSERRPEMREKLPSKNRKLNIAFFPEGGNLVNGLTSNVSFKVTDKQGNPVEATGRVCNKQGDVVATWKTEHDGMGSFSLTTKTGETYYAEVTSESGDDRKSDLPKALATGYVMSIDNMADTTLTVKVFKSSPSGGVESAPLGLTVMCRGQVLRFHQVEWEGDRYELTLPKRLLAEGVCQFTLFDTEGRVHADRLAFIPPRRSVKISMSGKKNSYLPREEVKLDFDVADDTGRPMSTIFSLAVRDADTETPEAGNQAGSMAANLLLGSDLKGYIHNVDYYLEADDAAHRRAVDLLVTTQGWRRYDWSQMSRPAEFEVTYPAEEGIMVMGNLTSTLFNRPREGAYIQVSIYGNDGDHLKGTSVVGEDGRFTFQAPDFNGRRIMHIATKKSKDKKDFTEMNVNLHKIARPVGRHVTDTEKQLRMPDAPQVVAVDTVPKAQLDAEDPKRYENLLPTVEVESSKEWESGTMRRWSTMLYDMADERMAMDETGENYLLEFYRWLEKTNPYFRFSIEASDSGGVSLSATYKGRPVIFFTKRLGSSEWTTTDAPYIDLASLTVQDVEAISISDKYGAIFNLPKDGASAAEGYSGREVLVTLFVRQNYRMREDARGQRRTLIQGFTPSIRFYVPDYSMAALPDEKDFRRTLFWEPYVVTNKEGKASVSFYNSPSASRLKVDAQTITFSGLMGGLSE